jgi:hypothetical protein
MWTPVVGKKFSVVEFEQYVSDLDFRHAPFKPLFVVHHNTAEPTRILWDTWRTRATPITDVQWLHNLAAFYQGKGWQAGPHLFVVPDGICVFTPLTHRGTHSPSWNYCSWGVEMVGDYDKEPYQDDLNETVTAASAILHHYAGLSPLPYVLGRRGLHFHKEDPRTTHSDCPGKNVVKADFVEAVMAKLERMDKAGHPDSQAGV